MAYVSIRRREMPTGPVQLDRSHPLTRGLKAFYRLGGANWATNLVNLQIGGSMFGTGTIVSSNWVKTPGIDTDYIVLDSGGFDGNAAEYSIVCGYYKVSGSVAWGYLSTITALFTGMASSDVTSVGTTVDNSFDGNLTIVQARPNENGIFDQACSLQLNNLRGFGGAAAVATATTAALANNSITSCALGVARRFITIDNSALAYFQYWGIYNRALTDTEKFEFCRNPWQILVPYRRPIYARVPSTITSITATKGTETWNGLSASVRANTNILTTLSSGGGSEIWNGLTASVRANTNILATRGTETWNGLTANIIVPTVILATRGSETWSGLTASINARTQVNATIGVETWSGLAASINARTQVNASLGVETWNGIAASVVIVSGALNIQATRGTEIWGSPGAASITGGGISTTQHPFRIFRAGKAKRGPIYRG